MAFILTCPTIPANHAIPAEFTCDGTDRTPGLSWNNPPDGTKSFALILHDPDSPKGDFTHWLLADIPAQRRDLPPGLAGVEFGVSGTNSFGRLGYGGPCPPANDRPHRYIFDLYALDTPSLGINAGAKRQSIEMAMEGHVLSQASCVGVYARSDRAEAVTASS